MTHQQQPYGSRLCGQTCVAILAGVGLWRALYATTGGKRRGTSEHDLRHGLAAFGLELGAFQKGGPYPPEGTYLLRMRSRRTNAHGYHWLVMRDGLRVFDPSMSDEDSFNGYWWRLQRQDGRITSHARVYPMTETLAALWAVRYGAAALFAD